MSCTRYTVDKFKIINIFANFLSDKFLKFWSSRTNIYDDNDCTITFFFFLVFFFLGCFLQFSSVNYSGKIFEKFKQMQSWNSLKRYQETLYSTNLSAVVDCLFGQLMIHARGLALSTNKLFCPVELFFFSCPNTESQDSLVEVQTFKSYS